MPDVVAEARKVIEDRLRELEREANRLRNALASLDLDSPRRKRTTSSSAARSRAGKGRAARRAPRGRRQAEFLAVLERNPGAKVAVIAEEMGVAPNQVYGVARRLHEAGKIRKRRGGGYAAKG